MEVFEMTRIVRMSPLAFLFAAAAGGLGCSSAPQDAGSEPAASSATQDLSSKAKRCHLDSQCGALEFCDTEAAKSCAGTGVCTARGITLMCATNQPAVCGCDGKPYLNACTAHKAGASVAPKGGFKATAIDGDTLAEMPWADETSSYFYAFTGDGTVANDSGTFEAVFSPGCRREQPACMIMSQPKKGTFMTYDSTLELDYDDGTYAFFDASLDCNNTWHLVGEDFGATRTLSVTTIQY
jgi:hypothetical protein